MWFIFFKLQYPVYEKKIVTRVQVKELRVGSQRVAIFDLMICGELRAKELWVVNQGDAGCEKTICVADLT